MTVLRWPGLWVVLETKLTTSDTDTAVPATVAGRVLGLIAEIRMWPGGQTSIEADWEVAVLRRETRFFSFEGVRSVFMNAKGLNLGFYEGQGIRTGERVRGK